MGLVRAQVAKNPERVFTTRGAVVSGELHGLVQGVEAGGDRELPVARSTAHGGVLARATGNAALRAAGDGRMGDGKK
jgi:hypothetical protein